MRSPGPRACRQARHAERPQRTETGACDRRATTLTKLPTKGASKSAHADAEISILSTRPRLRQQWYRGFLAKGHCPKRLQAPSSTERCLQHVPGSRLGLSTQAGPLHVDAIVEDLNRGGLGSNRGIGGRNMRATLLGLTVCVLAATAGSASADSRCRLSMLGDMVDSFGRPCVAGQRLGGRADVFTGSPAIIAPDAPPRRRIPRQQPLPSFGFTTGSIGPFTTGPLSPSTTTPLGPTPFTTRGR